MSIEDLVMAGMGLRRNVEPTQGSAAAAGGRAHAVGFGKNGERVAVPAPNPALPGYSRAMDRMDAWRSYGSPLGGISPAPWGQAPRFGDDALKKEFRKGGR
jgi:hypothetical protein